MFAAPLMAALTALVPPILFVTFALVRVQLATEVTRGTECKRWRKDDERMEQSAEMEEG
jgi:hypothetical protein